MAAAAALNLLKHASALEQMAALDRFVNLLNTADSIESCELSSDAVSGNSQSTIGGWVYYVEQDKAAAKESKH